MRNILTGAREEYIRKDITTAKRLFTLALNKGDFPAAEEQIQALKDLSPQPWDDISELQGRLNIAKGELEQQQRKVDQLKRDVEHEISKGRWKEAEKLINELEPLAGAAVIANLRKKLTQAKVDAEREKLVSQPLFELAAPLAGMVIRQAAEPDHGATRYAGGIQPDDRIACLTQKGDLFWMVGAKPVNQVKLGLKQANGLLEINESQLLVVDGSGELVRVEISDQGAFNTIERANTSKPIAACGLNSYRSMLAYFSAQDNAVGGFFLANKLEHEFYSHEGFVPALSFSADSISLAVGARDGSLYIIDIPTRQVKEIFEPVSLENFAVTTGGPFPEISPEDRPVRAVYASADHGWVSVHANHIVGWAKDQKPKGIAIHEQILSSALDNERKLLAVGTVSGGVYTYHMDGLKVNKYYKAHDKGLSQLLYSPDNRLLICVGDEKIVRSLMI